MTERIEHDAEREVQMASFILLRRINDVLLLILKNINEEDADLIANMHEQGIFASPPPTWRPGSDSDAE